MLISFLALTGAAAYTQTLTGFAFGLITMGGVGLAGLMPLSEAAIVVSFLTVVNATQILLKGWRDVAWREFGCIMAASIPMLLVGYSLLEWLAGAHLDLLRLILGVVIIVASLQLAGKRQLLAEKSHARSFAFFGAIAGLEGGMFSTAGPPLVYHLYRQPMPLERVRETLVTVFAVNAALRIAVMAGSGDLPWSSILAALVAIPAVMCATYSARRWPPRVSLVAMRRIVFLLISGISLAAPAVIHLFRTDA